MPPSLSSSGSGHKFRVAICGAGVAGLVLAITIGKYDPSIPIDLYEAHDSIDTAGAGIILGQRTHEAMIELGLLDDFKQIFTRDRGNVKGAVTRRSDIPEGGYTWYRSDRRLKNGPTPMHRKEMVAILAKHVPPSCKIHFGKRLANYTEPRREGVHLMSPIRIEFADGTTTITDILVGADGIRSAVRKALFEAASEDESGGDKTDIKQYIEAIFTGMTMYRTLVPAETLRTEDPENVSLNDVIIYDGKGRQLITYPIAKGALINVLAIISDPSLTGTHYEGRWTCDATRDELVGYFDGFEPYVKTVVKLCEKPSKWALHVVKPLPFCVRNTVALIGDACHAMTPHFSAGAGQAIDDAFVLGRLIAHPLMLLSRVPDALHIYEEVRLPLARQVADLSLSTGWMHPFMAPGYYDGTRKEDDLDDNGVSTYEKEEMETLKQEIFRRWDLIDDLRGTLQTWKDAESRLQATFAR